MVASGDTVASADVNLAQQRNAGPSILGTSDLASAAYATEAIVETITVPVVAGRKYRVSYTVHLVPVTTAGIPLYIKLHDTNASGLQITYIQHATTSTTFIDTRYLYGEWTATTTGNQVFVATVTRISGSTNTILKGSAGQPRILSVEWLGANA